MRGAVLRLAVFSLLAGACLMGRGLPAGAENWPMWRGPGGGGVSRERDLPFIWNEFRGILWERELPGWGTSQPVVWEDAVFVTAQQGEKLLLVRLEAKSGEVVWKRQVGSFEIREPQPRSCKPPEDRTRQRFHEAHNMASPTPLTDGKVVVAHFGNGDLVASDFDGEVLWRRNLQEDHGAYNVWWGHANSPVRFEELVINVCIQDPLEGAGARRRAPNYVVAHELATGERRWFAERPNEGSGAEGNSYITPALLQLGPAWRLVVLGGNVLDAYDPASGDRVWRLGRFAGGRTIASPVAAQGRVFGVQGGGGPLVAVRAGGSGELQRRDVAWRYDRGTPEVPSPVVWGDLLFYVTDSGNAKCLDVTNGQLHWRERLLGEYRASPVVAEGRVYFLNTEGTCTVVSATDRYRRLASNEIEDEFWASPAVSGGRMFLRGRKAVYCVAER